MAEPRRVHLTTLSRDEPPSSGRQASGSEPPPSASRAAEPASEPPAETDAVRLVLALFEPDERSFPEFSYGRLLDSKISHTKVSLSGFEEEEKTEDDEVAAIARKLEEKYGGRPKKKDRIQDLIDIGYGYDEEDSFIDNSEAYDEFVPASITTKFGGFYVNSGLLQFRQASDTETDAEDLTTEEKTLEHSKKRKLGDKRGKPKKKRCRETEMKNNVDSNSSSMSEIGQSDELKKRKKASVSTLSVTSMLRKFQRQKEKECQKIERENQKGTMIAGIPTLSLCPPDAAGGGGPALTDPLLSLIGSTEDHALIQAASTVDFDIDLDSLFDASEETLVPKSIPEPTKVAQLFHPTDDQIRLNAFAKAQAQNAKTYLQPKTHPEQTQHLSEASLPHQATLLPEGLPPTLEESIRKLTLAAKASEGESKLKFFTPEINSVLLDIELQCREQGAQVRSKVYTHLSSFLPCSRDTLLKRAKKLFVTHMEEPLDVEDPMQKLKKAIGRAMPEQIACYHESCQVYEQVKASKTTEEGNVATEDNVEEKGGKRGGPKKLFKWNEEIRECLCHVLGPKIERYTKERKGSREMEEYLKALLENEVKPLWPKGWMQSRLLIKETRKLLGLFSPLPVKKARSDKKQSISGASTVSEVHQGSPALEGNPPRDTDVFIEGSDISSFTSFGTVKMEHAVLKKGEGKKVGVAVHPGASTSLESEKPQVSATSASTHSLLDLLADQAIAQEQPLTGPQELIAAAVAKYKNSVQPWGFGLDIKSPPLPPAPPQSSPVGFPVRSACRMVLPELQRDVDDAGHVQIISADTMMVLSEDGCSIHGV